MTEIYTEVRLFIVKNSMNLSGRHFIFKMTSECFKNYYSLIDNYGIRRFSLDEV
jgi:hypothetical protein